MDTVLKVEQNTVDFCRVTHADPRCISSCVLVTAIVAMHLQSLAHEDSREDKEEQLQEPLEAGEAGSDPNNMNEKSAQRGRFGPDLPADIRPATSVRPSKSRKKINSVQTRCIVKGEA